MISSEDKSFLNNSMETIHDINDYEDSNENGTSPSTEIIAEVNKAEQSESGWIDVIGTGGLKKMVIKHGIVETRPVKGDTVRINATGRLEDGTEVDHLHETEFSVGAGEVIPGLEMVVELMDKGEICDVFMESRFAYGSMGLLPHIPSDVSLYYTVELVDLKLEEEPELMPVDERLEIGIRKRERGNWWFKREEFEQAIRCYKSAVDFLDDMSDTHGEALTPDLRKVLDERFKTMNNMAAAQTKVGAYDVALISLDAILQCQPANVKALYRKAKILSENGDSKKGLEAISKALQIEPDSRLLQGEAVKLKAKAQSEAESEKSLYRKMLGLKPNSDVRHETERYPVVKGRPFVVWGISFVVLLVILFGYKYRGVFIDV